MQTRNANLYEVTVRAMGVGQVRLVEAETADEAEAKTKERYASNMPGLGVDVHATHRVEVVAGMKFRIPV